MMTASGYSDDGEAGYGLVERQNNVAEVATNPRNFLLYQCQEELHEP